MTFFVRLLQIIYVLFIIHISQKLAYLYSKDKFLFNKNKIKIWNSILLTIFICKWKIRNVVASWMLNTWEPIDSFIQVFFTILFENQIKKWINDWTNNVKINMNTIIIILSAYIIYSYYSHTSKCVYAIYISTFFYVPF